LGIVSWVLGMVVLGEKTFFPIFQWPIFNSQYPVTLRREGAYAATHMKALSESRVLTNQTLDKEI